MLRLVIQYWHVPMMLMFVMLIARIDVDGFNYSILFLNALFYYTSQEMKVVLTLTCFKVTG